VTEKTIPLLSCRTELIQSVERGAVEIQLYGMKDYDPAASHSSCYVLTDDVDGLHIAFRSGLKAAYGRIPARGLPRIGPLKDMSYGVRQFLTTDPTGNTLRVGRMISGDSAEEPASAPKETFARALHMADLFADSKQDYPGAARIIDRVLNLEGEQPTPVQRVQLLVLRGDIAQRVGDEEAARAWLEEAGSVRLGADERETAHDALARLSDLRG